MYIIDIYGYKLQMEAESIFLHVATSHILGPHSIKVMGLTIGIHLEILVLMYAILALKERLCLWVT